MSITPTEQRYSIKKSRDWFWRTGLRRAQILHGFKESEAEWLVCPLGEAERAIRLDKFLANPDVFEDPSAVTQDVPSDASGSLRPVLNLIYAMAAFNFFGPQLMMAPGVGVFFGALVSGSILAQLGLVATWGVFSTASFGRRLLISALLGLLLYACFSFGLVAASRDTAVGQVVLSGLLCSPLLFLAVQAPLWGARTWLRWGIAVEAEPSGSYRTATSLRDMFTGMAAVGVGLGISRIAPTVLPEGNVQVFYFIMTAACAASFASLVVGAPLILICLELAKPTSIAAGLVGAMGVIVFGSIVVGVAALGGGAIETMLFFFLIGAAFVGATAGGFLMARNAGFRLRRYGASPVG